MEPRVRAAGGLVWRLSAGGGCEVLLGHRPHHQDWSLPKGKCEPGESDEACALREVEEETGLRCVLGIELPSSQYLDAAGCPKTVRYWSMRPDGGVFASNEEVDEVAWLTPQAAARRLTYAGDRRVLGAFCEQLSEG